MVSVDDADGSPLEGSPPAPEDATGTPPEAPSGVEAPRSRSVGLEAEGLVADPFQEPAEEPEEGLNPWLQGGLCLVLALVVTATGFVPMAMGGAVLAVALLYPIVPKVAEMCALVLSSCLVAYFAFELLQKIDLESVMSCAFAIAIGWGPITALVKAA